MPRQSKYGAGLQYSPKSAMTVLLIEPAAAMNLAQPATDVGLHETKWSQNWIHRHGKMEVRRGLSQSTQTSNPMGVTVTGGQEVVSSTGTFYPLISGTSRFAYHDGLGWSVLSYVSAAGNSAPPSGSSRDWYDMTQIYLAAVDDNISVMACKSQQTLFCWRAGATVFSGLTTAPKAKYITAFDNFLMAFNVKDSSGSNYVQRVQWSDRGNPSNWTGALSGFEDLLDAKGQGTRILAQENRVLMFFENEIWQGQRATLPAQFRFTPVDRSIGSPFGRTVVDTPFGTMFLGRDMMLYLLPKEGGTAEAIGAPIQLFLQQYGNVEMWAMWDGLTKTYQLYVGGDANLPVQAFYVVMPELSFNYQVWVGANPNVTGLQELSAGFTAYKQGGMAGTTWAAASSAGYTWDSVPGVWNDYGPQTGLQERQVFLGSSAGSMFRQDSISTTDDGTPIETQWWSPALGGYSPEASKTITQVRVDFDNLDGPGSTITMRVAGLSGSGISQGVPNFSDEPPTRQLVFDMYATDRYPMLVMDGTLPGGQVRISRFWVTMTEGGKAFRGGDF